MNKLKFLCILLCGALTVSCTSNSQTLTGISRSEVDSVSRSIGQSLGMMVVQSDFGKLNENLIINEFKKVLAGAEISQEEAMQNNNSIQNYMIKRQQILGEANAAAGKEFLTDNKTKEGVVELPDGLQYRILKEGNQVHPTVEDTVEVHYRGMLIDGTEFDSSYKRNEMAKFPLNRVIQGWKEGIQLIGEGGKIKLFIPSELGYGPNGPKAIGPNATLIFDIELNKIYPASKKETKK